MSRDEIHEIHPEELIAKAAARTLAGDEAADLDAHLRRCPACALHVSLRADVARALAPTDADYEVAARAVQRLLAATERAHELPAGRRRQVPAAARAAVIIAVILATSAATAALVWRARSKRAESTAAALATATVVENAHTRATRAAPEPQPVAEALPVPAPAVELGAGTPAEPQAPVVTAPAAVPAQVAVRRQPAFAPAENPFDPVGRARGEGRGQPPAQADPGLAEQQAPTAEARPADEAGRGAPQPAAQPAEQPAAQPAEQPAAQPAEQAETARALFEAAERAKRGGDAREAERVYARLAAAFSGSREEIAARPLRAQILLDDLGRPEDALASFDRYLRDRPTGVLAEEARAGRAEALRQLGRTPEEGDAWRDLLTRHPNSIYAARARKRLAVLDARE